MEYRATRERAFDSIIDDADDAVNYIGLIGIYSATRWWKNNYSWIKQGLDTYYAIGDSHQYNSMARRRYGRGSRKGRRKFSRRSRRYSRRSGGRRSIRRRVSGINRRLRRMGVYNVETKYAEFVTGRSIITEGSPDWEPWRAYKFNTTDFAYTMFDIAKGEGADDRVGQKIFLRHVYLKGILRATDSASSEVYVNWFIVRDKEPRASTNPPAIGDVATSLAAIDGWDSTETADITSVTFKHVNDTQTGRFSFLAKGAVKLGNDAGTNDQTQLVNLRVRVMQPVIYDQVLDDDGQSTRGNIYFGMWSNNAGETNGVVLNGRIRISFTDV